MNGTKEWIVEDTQQVRALGAQWSAIDSLLAPEDPIKLALEAARVGTFDWDLVRNQINSSRLYEELWGIPPDNPAPANEAFLQRTHPEDISELGSELNQCIAARKPFATEFRVVWPDRTVHWLMIRADFTFSPAGEPLRLLGIAMDISDRKQHEGSLRDASQQAEASNRAKSELLSTLSHDIRNPLTAIIGMTYLAMRANPDPPLDKYLTKIACASQSLLSISNDILNR
jgi:signal transduction histidine kinase